MTPAEAEALIAEWLRSDQKRDYTSYGYDLYLPNVILWHTRRDNPRVGEGEIVYRNSEAWSPVLASAAWDLSRRDILRPGVRAHNLQSTPDASAGFGFSLTPTGHEWLKDVDGNQFIPTAPHRFGELLGGFRERYGDGFFSRSQEAVRCFQAMLITPGSFLTPFMRYACPMTHRY